MAVGGGQTLKLRTLVMAGMASAIIVAMVTGQTWQTYNETVATSRRSVQQLNQILEAHADITFQSMELMIDRITAVVVRTQQENGQRPIIDQFVAIANKWTFIYFLAFIDADGMVRNNAVRREDNNLHILPGVVDVSALPSFIVHRNAPNAAEGSLYLSRPERGTNSPERVIAMTRAVRDKNGVFQGVCVITISLDTLTQVFADLLPTRYTSIELFRRDGSLLASSTLDRPYALTRNEKVLFSEMIPAAPAGVYRITSPSAGDSLVSYKVLQKYPVVLAVTADWKQIFAKWRNATLILVASALAGIAIIAVVAWRLVLRIAADERVQRAVRANERRMAETERMSGIGYYEATANSMEAGDWMESMYAIHGVDPKHFTPTPDAFLKLIFEEDRPKVRDAWARPNIRGMLTTVEGRLVLPDGSLRHMRYCWKVLEDGSAAPTRVCGVAQDITEIRNAEDTIRDEEKRLREILDCASDYIWEVNADNVFTLFNAAAKEQFGDSLGRPRQPHSHFYAADIEGGGDGVIMDRCIADRVRFRSLLIPVLNRDREVRWLRVSGNPRFNSRGKFLGYRGAGTDVTETRIALARDEAHRKTEALGRLASGLAHEINNLLQPIVIYANFGATQEDLAANVRQYFTRIGRAADRSMLIVRNVLAFAR